MILNLFNTALLLRETYCRKDAHETLINVIREAMFPLSVQERSEVKRLFECLT